MRRIACDAFSAIDNTEYTMNSTGYGWWQSHLYNFVDADHVVFNRESEGANRARLASAIVTGTLITGDDFSSNGPWSNTAKRLLQHKGLLSLLKNGHSFRPVDANTGNKGVGVFVKPNGILNVYLALFNYSNTPRTFSIPVSRLGLDALHRYSGVEYFTKSISSWSGTIQITVPPSDAMIYTIGTH
jgi:alpha-galactosidase